LVERRYSWQVIGDRLDAFYRRVVSQAHRAIESYSYDHQNHATTQF
jgi:hypothetical protein